MSEQEQERAAALAAAAAIGLTLPEPTVAGVIANRRMLAEHRARLAAGLAAAEQTPR